MYRDGDCPLCNRPFGRLQSLNGARRYWHTDQPGKKDWCLEAADGRRAKKRPPDDEPAIVQ